MRTCFVAEMDRKHRCDRPVVTASFFSHVSILFIAQSVMKLTPPGWGLAAFLFSLISIANGSALTTVIGANERSCFFAEVDKAGEKIGFYFAVQSGGSFDINFDVKDPNNKLMLDGKEERQGDYVFTANHVGEYAFCFENDMSTLTGKLIDIDITVESEPRRDLPIKPGQLADQTTALEESIYRLSNMLSGIRRKQRNAHTRERRGYFIVESTQSRIFWYSVLETAMIIGMAIVQVYVLQTFFTKTGRRYKV